MTIGKIPYSTIRLKSEKDHVLISNYYKTLRKDFLTSLSINIPSKQAAPVVVLLWQPCSASLPHPGSSAPNMPGQ